MPNRPLSAPNLAHSQTFVKGRARTGLIVTVAAMALVAGGGYWWYQKKQAADASAATAAAPKSGGAAGGRGGPRGAQGNSQTQPVSAGVVDQRDMRVLVSAIGTMSARATAVVRAKVSGELVKLHFKEGDDVKAGQLLAEIDPRSFQATLNQVQGTYQRDQALLKNAQLDLQRYKELQAQDSIANQQVDTQAALVRQYEGTVASDKAQVDAAKLQLSYTRVTAPISGRLGLRQSDLGNVVNPSDTNGLVTISQIKPIDAVFALPEAHVSTLSRRIADRQDLPVELWDRDQKQMLAKGRLNALDNTIDTTTGTVKAKAAFDNADARLFANQFVNVKLQVNLLENALTVPATAVQNNYVYLVKPDNTVTQRKITVGVTDGDRVSVQGDLQPGDQVVTDGIDRLREGAQVSIIASDKVNQVDQAVQNNAAGPRMPRNLPPEVRAKVANMTPEERKAFFQKMREERAARGEAGGGGPESGASRPREHASAPREGASAPSAPMAPASAASR
ncbi:MdtA/MuxA family multidrug efflux RND transporter periplasmic adaptor subunit [Diaphorobacter sp. HDW4A]|uniref:MdtA/MuxA family multidrug efflux RND transporter periplasmic adaptor subunit n=1 Tax=Diaphorobacter sp. HDW4A TaxID=2714924 RepID=UPI001407C933|nr:MdtA/MuxA family multidrug efflux RND transporter periplasmic adaptor subunit [Diaphorobacter sp. HDW4A]